MQGGGMLTRVPPPWTFESSSYDLYSAPSSSPSFLPNKRLCKSWPISTAPEPTSVLDARTPSPTSTRSSSQAASSLEAGPVVVSDLLSEVVSDGNRKLPVDSTSLAAHHQAPLWKQEPAQHIAHHHGGDQQGISDSLYDWQSAKKGNSNESSGGVTPPSSVQVLLNEMTCRNDGLLEDIAGIFTTTGARTTTGVGGVQRSENWHGSTPNGSFFPPTSSTSQSASSNGYPLLTHLQEPLESSSVHGVNTAVAVMQDLGNFTILEPSPPPPAGHPFTGWLPENNSNPNSYVAPFPQSHPGFGTPVSANSLPRFEPSSNPQPLVTVHVPTITDPLIKRHMSPGFHSPELGNPLFPGFQTLSKTFSSLPAPVFSFRPPLSDHGLSGLMSPQQQQQPMARIAPAVQGAMMTSMTLQAPKSELAMWQAGLPQSFEHLQGLPSAATKMLPPLPSVEDNLQLSVLRELLKSVEALELGKFSTAQAILARLNQQQLLSPHAGKPLQRAAFYFKEALHRHILSLSLSSSLSPTQQQQLPWPLEVFQNISAYKDYCESSPIPAFAHFSCNQALLEALQGEQNIHVIDFAPGLGGQWASFLQDMALRAGVRPPNLRMTMVGSESLEMRLTQDNLRRFASSLQLLFKINTVLVANLEHFSTSMLDIQDGEAIVITFGNGINRLYSEFSNVDSLMDFLMHLKSLLPKSMTVVEEEIEVDGASLSQYIWESLQLHASVFDSLGSANLAPEIVLKMEKFLFGPKIGKIVMEAARGSSKGCMNWRNLLGRVGFNERGMSIAAECQADIIMRRFASQKGFSVVTNRHGSLVLGWQGQPLVSASSWTC